MTKKVLQCIRRHWKGIIYYELLPYGQTLNSDLCCQPLKHLKLVIDHKRLELTNRKGAVFHQDKRQATDICSDSPETLGLG
ncbi:mariner transposase [Trichonephila clavipes]|nr:mariner transposase [Trichonephila clavipes]